MKTKYYFLLLFTLSFNYLCSYAQTGNSCGISIDSIEYRCYDHLTYTNASDDTYELDILVGNHKPGNTAQYHLIIDGTTVGTFFYYKKQTVQVKTLNKAVSIQAVDVDNSSCIADSLSNILTPCSESCKLTNIKVEIHCNNNGTLANPEDDYYSIPIFITSPAHKKGLLVKFDGNDIGLFPYNIKGYHNYKADGKPHDIAIIDADDNQCRYETTLGYFHPCSEECSIIVDTIYTTCKNNDTPINILDDKITLYFKVHGTNTSSHYKLFDVDKLLGIFPYGVLSKVDVLADGRIPKLRLEDNVDPYCYQTTTAPAFIHCSTDCSLVAIPKPNAGVDTFFNCVVNTIGLQGKVSKDSLLTYEWTNAQNKVIGTTKNVVVKDTGTYLFKVYHATGCPSIPDAIKITSNYTKPSVIIDSPNGTTLSCSTTKLPLKYNYSQDAKFNWTIAGGVKTSEEVTVQKAGWVVFQAQHNTSKCSAKDSVLINDVGTYPKVNVDKFKPLSCAKLNTIIKINPVNTQAIYSYSWFKNGISLKESLDSLIVNSPGTYTVDTYDKTTGCHSLDSILVKDISSKVDVIINPIPPIPCLQKDASISFKILDNGSEVKNFNAYKLQWIGPQGSSITKANDGKLVVTHTGEYSIKAVNIDNGCEAGSKINISPSTDKPRIDHYAMHNEKCYGDKNGMLDIKSIKGGKAPYVLKLNDKIIEQKIMENLSPGTYRVHIKDADGCTTDTTLLISEGNKFSIHTAKEIKINYKENYMLTAKVNLPINMIDTYSWSPSDKVSCAQCFETRVDNENSGVYTFKLKDIYGCEHEAQTRVAVIRDVKVFYPNVLKQGSSANGHFTLLANEHVNKIRLLSIFNRWGEMLWTRSDFDPNDYSLGWDGTFNGNDIMAGVYTFISEVEIHDGTLKTVRGDITVLK
jgi:hypothetical protein